MNINTTNIDKVLDRLEKKDPVLFSAVCKKIAQIAALDENEIRHFKNLRHSLSGCKRVHVSSFVLMFKLEGDTIIFDRFLHHDDAY